jgi:uncharacterized protein (DUF433 family)
MQIDQTKQRGKAGAMPQSLTLQVSDEGAEEIRRVAEEEQRPVSEVGARIVEDWARQHKFPEIEFRDILGERVACIKGRLEVWQFMMIAREYGDDLQGIADHLVLRPEQVQCALDYYAAYPEEIDAALAENDSMTYEEMKRRYPRLNIHLTEITDEDIARIEEKYPSLKELAL